MPRWGHCDVPLRPDATGFYTGKNMAPHFVALVGNELQAVIIQLLLGPETAIGRSPVYEPLRAQVHAAGPSRVQIVELHL